MNAKPIRKPRPICPECGSADVIVTTRTGRCDCCGVMLPADRFRNDGTVSGPMQRFSTDRLRRTDDAF